MSLIRMLSGVVLTCCLLAGSAAAAAADQVMFVVRHAERADQGGGPPPVGMMANDPPLSAAGHERAKKLAALLVSSEVKHIFTTELQRTRQTAAPLAERTGITAVTIPSRDSDALIQQVLKASGNVLIVGHSNTVADILKRLGVKTPISIGDGEFDNLFVVVRPAAGEPTLIRLRY